MTMFFLMLGGYVLPSKAWPFGTINDGPIPYSIKQKKSVDHFTHSKRRWIIQ